MYGPTIDAFLVTTLLVFIAELYTRDGMKGKNRKKNNRPAAGFALCIASFLAGIAADAGILSLIGVVGLCIFLPIDNPRFIVRRKGLQTLFSTIAAGVLLYIAGLRIQYFALAGMSSVDLSAIASLVATTLWVFIIVGLVEMLALVPLLLGILCIIVGSASLLPIEVYKSIAGQSLGGILVGFVAARILAEIVAGKPRTLEKSEVLIVGYLLAAASISMFIKSLALAGLILPVSLIVLVVMILVIQGFDRELLLRPSPRR